MQFKQEAELGHHGNICQQDREDKEELRPLTSDKMLQLLRRLPWVQRPQAKNNLGAGQKGSITL